MKTEDEKNQERTEYIHKAIEKAKAIVELSAKNAMIEAIAESAYKFIAWNQIAEEEREKLNARIAELEKQLAERDAKPPNIVGHIDVEKLAGVISDSFWPARANDEWDHVVAAAAIAYIREHCAPRWLTSEEAKALGLKDWIWAVRNEPTNAWGITEPNFDSSNLYCPLIEISKIKEEVKP